MPDPPYCRIPLPNGDHALVDPEDFARFGDMTWHNHTAGYACRSAHEPGSRKIRTVYLHREILGLTRGDGLQADHINRNRLDCRRENLRIVTNAENSQNRPSRGGSSQYRGVYWHKKSGKWMARVKLNYKHHYLGCFDDELEAARAAAEFRRERTPFSQPEPWETKAA